MVKLVLIRHGQSIANKENVYTGWNDAPLTELGVKQAILAGQALAQNELEFTDIHTSLLGRAIKTANLVAEACHQLYLPLHKTWRLNERHYGALRGLNKDDTRKIYGKHQVALWRRSFYAIPPALTKPDLERRYANLDPRSIPTAESLAQALDRIMPYWQDEIAPKLLAGKNQLVVAHGSTLRALIKYLESISDEGIDGLEVENCQPIIYELDGQLKIVKKEII